MKVLTRLFTKNLTKIPLLWITFNWKLFKKNVQKVLACVIFILA